MHNVRHKFKSVAALQLALWHEFEELVPEEAKEFNVGYFEGKSHSKKWLVSAQDLEAMYTHYDGKECISLWCDGKQQQEQGAVGQKRKAKGESHSSKRAEREEEVDDLFQKLKKKHKDSFSGPQLRLWARMVAVGTHSDMDSPPNVPMIVGGITQQPRRESFSDVMCTAATAFAKALSPPPAQCPQGPSSTSQTQSPNKTVDVRMKNLEQLRYLQQLKGEGILSEEEYLTQKQIVLKALNRLV